MNEINVTVCGNLVTDVTTRTTAKGEAMATFRIASTVTRFDRNEGRWVDQESSYWNVVAYRRAAQNAASSLAKGHPVVVHGRIKQRSTQREVAEAPGVRVPVTYTDIEALSLGLDLSRCRAEFRRAPVGPQTSADASDAA